MSNRANFAVCSPTSFVLMKDILCRRAYSHEHFIHFFLGVTARLNIEIWPKLRILLKQIVSPTPLKPLNKIYWNYVVMKDILCTCSYLLDILIWLFLRTYRSKGQKYIILCKFCETGLYRYMSLNEIEAVCIYFDSKCLNTSHMWRLLIDYMHPIITNFRLWISVRLPNAWHWHS